MIIMTTATTIPPIPNIAPMQTMLNSMLSSTMHSIQTPNAMQSCFKNAIKAEPVAICSVASSLVAYDERTDNQI